MPRVRGPRKKPNGGPNFYACLTVPKALRQKARKTELWRSLGTANPTLASKLYGAAIEALERDLEELVADLPLAEQVELNRGRLLTAVSIEKDGRTQLKEFEDDDPLLVAEALTKGREDQVDAFPLVYEALSSSERMAVTWEELRDHYAKVRATKKGQTLSSSALFEVNKAIEVMSRYASYPDLLTVKHCRQIYRYYIDQSGLKPKTVMSRLGMAKTMIKAGIKHEVLRLQSNPWDPIDFIVQDRPEDSYRPFSDDEIRQLFAITEYPQVWYLLFGTALRIGELWSRESDHLDGQMLKIIPSKRQGNRLKTQTSIRRVPLNQTAIDYFRFIAPYPKSQDTLQRYLRAELNMLSSRDEKLVIHSTRHTWKTWSRRVGMPIDVSDEIDGHKKKITTDVSDGYGIYPDELLLEQGQKIWNYLDSLLINNS